MSISPFNLRPAQISVCALMLMLSGLSYAQERTYIEEYRRYQAAVERNDVAAAKEHGKAAWQLAQAQLGDHATTAMLAYNYGFVSLFFDPEGALPALSNAEQLMHQGLVELPAHDLAVYIAFAGYVVNGGSRSDVRALRTALDARDGADEPPVYEIFQIWSAQAGHEFNNGNFQQTEHSATKALEMIDELFPDSHHLRAPLLTLRGASRLVMFSRRGSLPNLGSNIIRRPQTEMAEAAYTDFSEVINGFPAVSSGYDLEPVVARALAWSLATRALVQAYLPRDADRLLARCPGYQFPLVLSADCGAEWLNRRAPAFPDRYIMLGNSGAVLVIHDIDEDGRVVNARVVAEVPSEAFGSYALVAMENWQLDPEAALPEECRRGILQRFTFTLST